MGERAFRVVVMAGPEAGGPRMRLGPMRQWVLMRRGAILDALADELDL